ncbi:hypothetical protein MJT46_012131 [Ovis ammon polii x Ovis aries]|nr:hypothetical protein MJT46_012131 [Ovis ammon polii x Ovis aries]
MFNETKRLVPSLIEFKGVNTRHTELFQRQEEQLADKDLTQSPWPLLFSVCPQCGSFSFPSPSSVPASYWTASLCKEAIDGEVTISRRLFPEARKAQFFPQPHVKDAFRCRARRAWRGSLSTCEMQLTENARLDERATDAADLAGGRVPGDIVPSNQTTGYERP